MTSNTHPHPFPTLPPPHACMVNLNHTKIIPSILRGICTLSQLYQYRLSVYCRTARAKWALCAHSFNPLAAFPPHLVPCMINLSREVASGTLAVGVKGGTREICPCPWASNPLC